MSITAVRAPHSETLLPDGTRGRSRNGLAAANNAEVRHGAVRVRRTPGDSDKPPTDRQPARYPAVVADTTLIEPHNPVLVAKDACP